MTCVPSSLRDSRREVREGRRFEAVSAARLLTAGLEQQEEEQPVGRKERKRILQVAETLTLRMRNR